MKRLPEQPMFTPDELIAVYARRRQVAEFIRRCLPTAMQLAKGISTWHRMIAFSVPNTTTPQPEGQGAEGQGT